MHSSSHFTVRSTEVLFLFCDTQAGTSSAKVVHKSGFVEDIIFIYSMGFICKIMSNRVKKSSIQSEGKCLVAKTKKRKANYHYQNTYRETHQVTARGGFKRSTKLVAAITFWNTYIRIPWRSC